MLNASSEAKGGSLSLFSGSGKDKAGSNGLFSICRSSISQVLWRLIRPQYPPSMVTTDTQSRRQMVVSRSEYVARINRVLDHIENNIAGDLSLNALARVAAFSPFHFHRVFGMMMGETPGQFIQRVRVERAASLLVQLPRASVTEIALDNGFSSSAAFARVFKETYGMSATRWRAGGHREHCKPDRRLPACDDMNGDGDFGIIEQMVVPGTRRLRWRVRVEKLEPAVVEIEQSPDHHIAYVRHIGAYAGLTEVFAELFGRLMRWAGPRGLVERPDAQILAVYHDNPELTEDNKLRVDACVTVPPGTEVSGEVGYRTIQGGTQAVGHFALAGDEYHLGWHALVGGWLPSSGFEPDDRLCYERYPVEPEPREDGRTPVDICIPVRPM